jgi:hypothetical protein
MAAKCVQHFPPDNPRQAPVSTEGGDRHMVVSDTVSIMPGVPSDKTLTILRICTDHPEVLI